MAKRPNPIKAKQAAYEKHMAAQRKFTCRDKTGVSNHDGSCLKCDAPQGGKCKDKAS